METACLLDDHVCTLHNSSHIRIHLKLKNDEVWSVLRRDHLFWKFNLNCFVSDLSTAWEEITLHAHWSDWHVSLGIVADFDSAVAFLGDSFCSPLDVVLGSLRSKEMSFVVHVDTTVLSLGGISCLWYINE